MAAKKTKSSKTASKTTHHRATTTKKAYDPHESLIIQGGIVFIMVAAIAIFSYVMSMYGVLQ